MAPLQFCTVSSRQYVPFAETLAASIRRHHPDSELWILLADDHSRETTTQCASARLVWNEDLGIEPEELHRLFLIHGGEFIAAVKPFLIEHVIRETNGPVLFLDSDIHIYRPLDDVGELIAEHGIVLTPHLISPLPLDDFGPDDTTILMAGTFQAGMIGVGQKGKGLLDFLKSRLRRECVIDPARMRANEQRWLDFAPSFFDVHVLRDPGVNVAYWNIHERPLRIEDGRMHAGGSPLRAFHFSGYELDKPEVLSRHAGPRPRVELANEPIAQRLCADFREAVMAAGFHPERSIPVDFEELPGGIPVDPALRAVFRAAVVAAERQALAYPPDPYDLTQRPLFLRWAQLTYSTANLPVPVWAGGAAVQPAPAAMAPPPSGEPSELIRRLASSSSAAIANLDNRISEIERQLSALARGAA